jgi:two-component system sensor histidine kinase EvgS
LKLVVEDSGFGIKETDLQRVFTSFSKPKSKNHLVNHTGVGLGLTFCKNICEELGGTI